MCAATLDVCPAGASVFADDARAMLPLLMIAPCATQIVRARRRFTRAADMLIGNASSIFRRAAPRCRLPRRGVDDAVDVAMPFLRELRRYHAILPLLFCSPLFRCCYASACHLRCNDTIFFAAMPVYYAAFLMPLIPPRLRSCCHTLREIFFFASLHCRCGAFRRELACCRAMLPCRCCCCAYYAIDAAAAAVAAAADFSALLRFSYDATLMLRAICCRCGSCYARCHLPPRCRHCCLRCRCCRRRLSRR